MINEIYFSVLSKLWFKIILFLEVVTVVALKKVLIKKIQSAESNKS